MKSRMLAISLFAGLLVLLIAGGYTLLKGSGNPPAIGSPAPDFTLNAQDELPVKLSAFRGQWVVLYFYPKDFTSGCTIEAHNFQRDLSEYQKRNAVILGHTFLIDPQGAVEKILLNVDVKKHSEEILAKLDEFEKNKIATP